MESVEKTVSRWWENSSIGSQGPSETAMVSPSSPSEWCRELGEGPAWLL